MRIPELSRFTGCLLGGALGDALGYPVEFLRTSAQIERVLGPVSPERLPRQPGGKALVSDDTQMTLFTAEGLIRAAHRAMDRGLCSPPISAGSRRRPRRGSIDGRTRCGAAGCSTFLS